jgi:tRNA (adenine22-N1)-methyltransferase
LSQRAIACDINRGPIESARRNIEAAGLSDRIDTMQTDGLHGVERFHPTDILIFGMGGELIARILSEAPWVKDEGIGLILQPMSHAEILRRWLMENGFSILGETLTWEDQYYQTIHARYCGESYALTEEELFFGREILAGNSPLLEGYLKGRAKTLNTVIAGKKKGNADVELERRLIRAIEARLGKKGESET